MPVNIFNDNERPGEEAGGGRFRSGMQYRGKPKSLSVWRLTTGDPEVAAAIAENFDGKKPKKWDTEGQENIEVLTKVPSLDVYFERPGSIQTSLVLWGNNKKIMETDGHYVMDGQKITDDVCDMVAGKTRAEIKAAGFDASIALYFRLVGHEELGTFKFFSQSWAILDDFAASEAALYELDGPATAVLSLEPQEFTKMDDTGEEQTIKYYKAILSELTPAEPLEG